MSRGTVSIVRWTTVKPSFTLGLKSVEKEHYVYVQITSLARDLLYNTSARVQHTEFNTPWIHLPE